MEPQQEEKEQEQQQQSPADDVDPRLDLTSPEFDAQLALQTTDVQLPVTDAPVLDNISRCAGMLQQDDSSQKPQQQQQQESGPSAQEVSTVPPAALKLLNSVPPGPHQPWAAPISLLLSPLPAHTPHTHTHTHTQAQAKKAKAAALKQRALQAASRAEASVKLGSLPAIMDAAAVGPLAVLAKWHASQQRIYVVTRHASGVRGRAIGTLVAFDKYLNLLLRDVEETYTVIVKVQRIKQQQQQQVPAQAGQQQHLPPPAPLQEQQQREAHQQQQPEQQQHPGQQQVQAEAGRGVRTRTRWCRKQQQRYRHLDQILLKGDNIVLLSGSPPSNLQPAAAAAGAAAAAAAVPGCVAVL
jgi:small nuclear ribonucleoprotein (snRNP)-like protein